MKQYYLAIICLVCFFQSENAISQNLQSPCGSDYWHGKTLQDPTLFQKNQEYEKGILQVFEQKKVTSGTPEQAKILPVVVHIIHDNGAENISDAQVQQAIAWLNQALANQGAFNQGSGIDCGIQLCFAQRTPDGQATNGITRNQSPLTEMQMESQDIQVKNLNRWKPKDYVNIWLVRSICSSTYGCGVYGYANYPYAHGSNIDGIVIEAAYLTQIEKITGLAHEMGHYLGLYHTFEGGCANNNCMLDGDHICDTPPDQSTAGVPCGDLVNTCSTDTQSGPFATDQPDMSWNFMDYGIIACFHDFTADQSTRMNATIDGVRHSLLNSKGCLPPCPTPTVAAFSASATTVAVGETVMFENTSQNAGAYLWSVDGLSFETQPNASYTFNAAGTYTIVLLVQPANSALCDASAAQLTIQVYCPVTASFNLSNLGPSVNEVITLNNTSQNATQTEWHVNGISQGATLDSLSFNTPGIYQVTLAASNGLCGDTTTVFVNVQTECLLKTYEIYARTGFSVASPTSITELTDGNMILTGYGSNTSESAPLFVKMNPDGEMLFAKKIGLDSSSTVSILVRATPDGGFVVFYIEQPWNTPFPTIYYFNLIKFSADGTQLWSKRIRWSKVSLLNDMLINSDGSIIIAGQLLAKFNSAGNLLWAKDYPDTKRLAAYPDGGFLALDINSVVRFDEMGNILWRRLLHVDPSINNTSLLALPDGEIFVAGEIGTGAINSQHGYLLKMTQDGETIWAKTFGQVLLSTYLFQTMIRAHNGNLIIAGYAKADNPGPGQLVPYSILMEIDLNGNLVWIRHRTHTVNAYEMVSVSSGGYAIVEDELVVLKTDNLGQTIGCEEDPHTINVNDFTLMNFPVPILVPDSLPEITQAVVLIADLPFWKDTLCTPDCKHIFEICNNNLDDDEDGLFDCLDPDCVCTESLCAPKQANIWHFGYQAGLDFSTEPPKVLSGGMTQTSGVSATVCDVAGNLLFYTDGFTVFNRFHESMPNGSFQIFNNVYQSIIIPHPGNPNQYYVVVNYPGGLIYYSLVDMSLDDGKGDIELAEKNILFASASVGLAAVKSCAFNGYWLLVRTEVTESDFYAFRIDENGLNLVPVVSNTGQGVTYAHQTKISPDGSRIACAYYGQNTAFSFLSIYDFDAFSTGKVTNPLVLRSFLIPNEINGVEFSPNSRFLYVSGQFQGNIKLLQFDLEAGDMEAINNSMVQFPNPSGRNLGYLQLASNGKIYTPSKSIFEPTTHFLDVIHQPDQPGFACQYQVQSLDIAGSDQLGSVWFGLSNVISSYFEKPYISFPNDAPDTICVLHTPVQYHIPNIGCETDSLVWKVDNLDAQISPDNENAVIQYLNPGSGRLIVTVYTVCGSAADTLDILVAAPLNKTLDLGPDLVVCQNGVFSFNAGSGFARYLWSDGTADSTTTTLFPGKYWVKVWDLCGNLQTDTITVSIAPGTVLDLGPDLPQQCSGFSASYQRPANFDSWKWSPGTFLNCTDCPEVTLSPNVSAQWVVVAQTDQGCISVDTLNATIRDTLLFSRDTFVCEGQTLAFLGAQLPADTTAEFFLPAPGMGCDTLLTVHVLGIENSASAVTVTICADAVFEYHGALLPADTVAVFHLASLQACDSLVTVQVKAFPPLSLTLPMDTTIRIGASVLLEADVNGSGTLDFVWSPPDGLSCIACPDPLANPLDTITYTLAVTDKNGCTAQESVTIRVSEECRVQIPTAFTPNGDGSNDLFRPIMDPCVRTVRLWRIVNRWGQTVFEQVNLPATDAGLGWDGSWKGKAHPSDVLVWMAEFEYYDGRRTTERGELTLLR